MVAFGGSFIPEMFSPTTVARNELLQKIANTDSNEMELIAYKISCCIVGHLGQDNKERVQQIIMQKTGVSFENDSLFAIVESEDVKKTKTIQKLTSILKMIIQNEFSTPEVFLHEGFEILLTSHHVKGLLQRKPLQMQAEHIPPNYTATLTLDKNWSRSDLFFTLKEKSNDIKFSQQRFSLEELEEKTYTKRNK